MYSLIKTVELDGVDMFPYATRIKHAAAIAEQYGTAEPCQHVYIEDFINPGEALRASQEFPPPDTEAWIHYKHHNENKLGLTKRDLFPASLGRIADELNSPRFIAWLSAITGIPELMADPMFEGGGLHQSGRGGFLNVHTDFSMHHYHEGWRRRINLLLYLNPDWRVEWGGSIELWDTSMKRCVRSYPPVLNSALIFTTDERSLHGFPEPLTCPEGVSRKSLAFYYYTCNGENTRPVSTNYKPRPTDGLVESLLIRVDKVAVDIYSRAKARFGFSDDRLSRLLRRTDRSK